MRIDNLLTIRSNICYMKKGKFSYARKKMTRAQEEVEAKVGYC